MNNPPPIDLAWLHEAALLGPVTGCERLVAHQSADLFALWQAWEAQSGQVLLDPPFWGVVWPAAARLARFLLAHPTWTRQRRVLELACGGGVVSVAAAMAGAAEVLATDIEPVALAITASNARANHVTVVTAREDALAAASRRADVIVVADFFYEQQTSRTLELRLRSLADQGTVVLLADAGRPFAPRRGIELLDRAEVPVPHDLEGVASRLTRVVRLLGGVGKKNTLVWAEG